MTRKIPAIVLLIAIALFLLYWAILIMAIPFNLRTPSETDLSKSTLRVQPPPPLAHEIALKIVTFNIHDLYAVSKHRPERMRGIAQTLRDLDHPDQAEARPCQSSPRQLIRGRTFDTVSISSLASQNDKERRT
jgi:predicted secreted protein